MRLVYSICSAWMAMSAAVPPMPPDGWCIMIRAWRQRVPLARGAGAEQQLAHRRGHAHRDGRDVVVDELHRVVDGHAGVDRTTGAS